MDRQTLLMWRDSLMDERDRATRKLEHIEALLEDMPEPPAKTRPQRQSQLRRNTKNAAAADAVYEILAEATHPMHRNTLFEHLGEQGFTFGGKKPIATFAAILSVDQRFQKSSPKGWWELSKNGEGISPALEANPTLLDDAAVTER